MSICHFLSLLVGNFLSVFGTKCQIMTKNAVPFNIPNNDRSFQSDSKKCQNYFVLEISGNFQKIPLDFRKG